MNYLTTSKSLSSIFDEIFFKDIFNDAFFNPLPRITKIDYPVDIYETKDGLVLDIVATGLDKSEIAIDVKDDILKVSHQKGVSDVEIDYAYKGITSKSFSLSWRINDKFDLTKVVAKLDRGILNLLVPLSAEMKFMLIYVKIS